MRRIAFSVVGGLVLVASAGFASAQPASPLVAVGDFDGDGMEDKAEYTSVAGAPDLTVYLGSGGKVKLFDASMTAGDLFEIRHGGAFRPPAARRSQPAPITVATDVIVQGWKSGPKLVWYFRDGSFRAIRQN